MLIAVVSKVGDSAKNVQRIAVDLPSKKWSWATDFDWPHSVDQVKPLCAGSLPLDPAGKGVPSFGIFGLDTTQGKERLHFSGLQGKGDGPRSPAKVELPIIDKPLCLATTIDSDGYSNLLVGGENGILHVTSQECTASVDDQNRIRQPTMTGDMLHGVRKLHVAQNNRSLVLWALNADDNVVYQPADLKFRSRREQVDDMVSNGSCIPLLAGVKNVQTFSAMFDPKKSSQNIFVLRYDGSVARLQQAGDSKLWSEESFRIPESEEVHDVNTYTCHLHFVDNQNAPQVGSDVKIRSSSQTVASINARVVHLDSAGRDVKTDAKGNLTIIVPASDLQTPNLTISSENIDTFMFNPAAKAVKKLSTTAENGELAKAKSQDGSPLFSNVNEKSIQTVKDLHQKFESQLSSDNASSSSNSDTTLTPASQQARRAGQNGTSWEFFHWVTQAAHDVGEWFIEAGKFVIQIAGKIWTFIVETAEHVLKALSTILKWLADKLEDALMWLASKIDWTNVIDTQTILNEVFDTSILYVEDAVTTLGDKVHKALEKLETDIAAWHIPPNLPGDIENLKPDSNSQDKSKTEYGNNPLCNWGQYQLDHGGAKDSVAAATSQHADNDPFTIITNLFEESIEPLWTTLKTTMDSVWTDVKQLFDPNSSLSFLDIIKNVGSDILQAFIRALRSVLDSAFAAFLKILTWLKTALNEPLDIWLLTKLYAKITGGQRLTIRNLFTWLLAVPTSFIFSLVADKKPKDVPHIQEFLTEIKSRATPQPLPSGEVTHRMAAADGTVDKGNSSDSEPIVVKRQNFLGRQAATPLGKKPPKPMQHDFRGQLIYAYRYAYPLINAAVAGYAIYDTIATAVEWELPQSTAQVTTKTLVLDVLTAVGLSAFDFPWQKFSRGEHSGNLRMIQWSVGAGFNMFKALVPVARKPIFIGAGGIFDAVLYALVLEAESSAGGATDNAYEISNRYLADAWAMASCYNASNKGKQPVALGIAAVIALAFNVENIIMVEKQCDYSLKYFDQYGWDENYSPPSFSTSLTGSLL